MEFDEREWELISHCFLFSELEPETGRKLFQQDGCSIREFRRGEQIYGGSHFERSLGLLLFGRAAVRKPTDDGRGLAISTLRTGMLFGAAAVFNETGSFVNEIMALEPCRVLLMHQDWFRAVMQEHFCVTEAYLRYLSERILFLNERMAALAAGSADQVLAHFLLQNGPNLTISMTELASRLKLGRASLYRAIGRLEANGAICRSGKTLTVVKPDILMGTEQHKEGEECE